MSNYPPGVTGNEWAITGPTHEKERVEPCPKCGTQALMELGHRDRGVWVVCQDCDWTMDLSDEDAVIPEPEFCGDCGKIAPLNGPCLCSETCDKCGSVNEIERDYGNFTSCRRCVAENAIEAAMLRRES